AGAGHGASGEAHGVVAERGESVARTPGRNGRGLEPPRRIPDELRRRSLAKSHRFCVQLCSGAGTGQGRRGGTASERGVRAAVFSKASAATSIRRDDRAGSAGRVSGRRRPSHGKPGGKTQSRCRGAFGRAGSAARGIAAAGSAAVRLHRAARSGHASKADARRRRHQGGLGATAGGLRLARRQSGSRRQQMDLPHRRRSVLLMTRESTETRRLSRAAIEMLAIIAYHQPVTRAEIEEIRGVITSKGTLDVLLETGWIRPRGRRKTPGRPLTFGTTEAFLSQFSLEALGDLPGLEELKGTGLLDSRLPSGFGVPTPSDDPALRDDEDPLEIGDLELALAPAVEPEI